MSIENAMSKFRHSRGVLCVANHMPHLRSGSVESDACYRHVCSSGAKVSDLDVVFDLTFVQSNLHDEPISYIELML